MTRWSTAFAPSLALLASLLVGAAPALSAQSDTTQVAHEPLFTTRDAFYAAAFTVGTAAVMPYDRRIAHWVRRPGLHPSGLAERVDSLFRLTAVPGALVIGGSMYVVGRLAHVERVADLGLHGTEALLVGSAVGGLVKGVLGRARPYAVRDSNQYDFAIGRGFRRGTDYSSLPSGHVTAAFAAASAVTAETQRWWPRSTPFVAPVLYGGAALVAASRLYDDKHWASDAVLGAMIGTFSGIKVVKYHHAHPGNRLDRWLLAVTPVPDGRGGIALAWTVSAPPALGGAR
jgi:membrane-associated phospholipid phosphatase